MPKNTELESVSDNSVRDSLLAELQSWTEEAHQRPLVG